MVIKTAKKGSSGLLRVADSKSLNHILITVTLREREREQALKLGGLSQAKPRKLLKSKAMGFVVGSSCFSQPSPSQLLFASSSSSSSSRSIFVYSPSRNAHASGRRTVTMASLGQEDPRDRFSSQRRAIFLAGVVVLPFLQLRARALEGLAASKFDCRLVLSRVVPPFSRW